WWDQWLKGKDTGIMNEPRLRVWMQDAVSPFTRYDERPGRWVSEPVWPSPNISEQRYALGEGGRLVPLAPEQSPEEVGGSEHLPEISPLSVGLFAGKWCAYASAPDLPGDQREEDGGALVFQTAPLRKPLELLGRAVIELDVEADEPVAMLCVRLSDMGLDQKSTRVTYGLLNLTHRDSREHPAPLEPGKRYRVHINLNDVGHRFPEGHRVRLSISTSYWPLAWPPPRKTRVVVHTAGCIARLPIRSPESPDGEVHFLPPEGARKMDIKQIEPSDYSWRITRDLADDLSTLEVVGDGGTVYFPDSDLTVERASRERYAFRGDDFNSVRGETCASRSFQRGDWSVRIETRTVLSSTAEAFSISAELDAYEGDVRVFSRNWQRDIPRRLV
ncbi:MAG: CocE/NonD family hydrolase, partial [Bacteroidota bacterium]